MKNEAKKIFEFVANPKSQRVTIADTSMMIKEYDGKRVVTFADVDAVHQRPEGTAGRNFRANKEHFIIGVDYMKISPDEFRRDI